jgi:hypothetical protein
MEEGMAEQRASARLVAAQATKPVRVSEPQARRKERRSVTDVAASRFSFSNVSRPISAQNHFSSSCLFSCGGYVNIAYGRLLPRTW